MTTTEKIYLNGTKRLNMNKIGFDDEIIEIDHLLGFYIPVWFDVEEVFGINVNTAENDDFVNVYAEYNLETGEVVPELTVILAGSDKDTAYYRRRRNTPCFSYGDISRILRIAIIGKSVYNKVK